MITLPHFQRCGLSGVGTVPIGMHACHFYTDRAELTATLVPYFVTGLREKERCLWITAPPLPATDAIQALRAAHHGVDDAIEAGALRVIDFQDWYGSAGQLKGLDVIQFWLNEEERALAEGYNGLRITGNTSFLEPGDWSTFMEYEQAISESFKGRPILTLCSYARRQCNDEQFDEVLSAHHCGFEGPDAYGQVITISQRPRLRTELSRSFDRQQADIHDGVVVHERPPIINVNGAPNSGLIVDEDAQSRAHLTRLLSPH